MKKIVFLGALMAGLAFASCSDSGEEIAVSNPTIIRVNPSTIMEPFTYQISPGDLDGVREGQSIRLRLYAYDESGVLFDSEEQTVPNYLTSAVFNLGLEEGMSYTVVVISDVMDSTEGSVAEYWSVSDERNLGTLKVNYEGSDSNYGDQEILGISSATVFSGNDTSIDLEPAGALICTMFDNVHAYSNINQMLLYGSRGNGYFDFSSNGALNANPDLEALPDFLGLADLSSDSYNIHYSYKFLMPQTNYDFFFILADLDGNVVYSKNIHSGVALQRGHEYNWYILFDPNGTGDGTFSYTFDDVTGKVYSRSANGVSTKALPDATAAQAVVSTSASPKSYKVKDLL